MSPQQRATRVPSIAKSIDSVLDTTPASRPSSPPVRPFATLRPSWIGPPPSERPVTPGVESMKQIVTVEHSSPGLQPPVFIFTSLSDPQWEPVEMESKSDGHGGFIFSKTFSVEEGEYQYKFRLGEGDWWTCDESKPTVDDGSGNKNNLLVVKPEVNSEPPKSEATKIEIPKTEQKVEIAASRESQTALKVPEVVPLPSSQLQPPTLTTPARESSPPPGLLLRHEVYDPHMGSAAEQTPEREEPNPFEVDEEEPDKSSVQGPKEHEEHAAPLFRHESARPSSIEQEHAPLFRHESISLGSNHHDSPGTTITPTRARVRTMSSPPVAPEAEPHEYMLEKFPIDHAGIMEKIRSTHKRLPEDRTSEEDDLDSPISQAMSESSISPPSLPIVREEDEEMLENIRRAEEEEVEKEVKTGEEVDPAAPMTPPQTPPEAEDADFEPKTTYAEAEMETVIEVVEQPRGLLEVLVGAVGGQGNALAIALGLLAVAAGLCAVRSL